MAFFKFRFPGQAEQAATSIDAVPVGSAENIDVVRRRARHRLIGAVVLVTGAVIVFPLLFDTQPRPVAANTPIVMPDRQGAPAPVAIAVQRQAQSVAPVQSPLPNTAGLDAGEQVVSAATPKNLSDKPSSPTVSPPAAPEVPILQTVPKPAAVIASPPPGDKPVVAKPIKPEQAPKKEPAAKPQDDGSKVKSLLDGKPAVATGRHVLQVGAFSDTAKVREVRQKLQQAGVTTYTQVIEGNDGKTTTRVRVGPFDSRDEAEKVAARVRKLGLSPAILKL